MNTIDTTNKIFRISCGAEFALKLIGVMKPRPILELPPRFGVPAPIWRSPAADRGGAARVAPPTMLLIG